MPTTIKTKNSTTSSATPTGLVQGELAVNIADRKLYVGDASGNSVQIAGQGSTNTAGGSNTQVQFNSSGALAGSSNMTFNGTTLTVADLTDSSLTPGRVVFPTTGGNLTGSANLFWDNTSGSLGIGTSSPAKRLAVQNSTDSTTVGTNAVMTVQAGSSVNSVAEIGFGYNGWSGTNPLCTIGYQITSNAGVGLGAITFATRNVTTDTAPTERMRIDSSGNVGIGTSSPIARLHVANSSATSTSQFGNLLAHFASNATNADASIQISNGVDNSARIGIVGGSNLYFSQNGSERMRIDSSGNLLVNTTTATNPSLSQGFVTVNATGTKNAMVARLNQSGYTALAVEPIGHNSWYFGYMANSSGGNIGSISCNSTSTAYNTSSDYRLKENIAPMTGALAKVSQLKPCTYTWKIDGSDGQGFIAHELAEVCPDAVVGEKDAVDAEGKPVYQGIDTSFLVATLTAAIQELNAKVDALQTELAKLKGN